MKRKLHELDGSNSLNWPDIARYFQSEWEFMLEQVKPISLDQQRPYIKQSFDLMWKFVDKIKSEMCDKKSVKINDVKIF
jgi:hypothetical protein